MKLKKWAISLLAILMIASFNAPTFADEEEAIVEVEDGVLSNNRVLIPLRVVSSKLGGDIKWYPEDRYIQIHTKEKGILLAVNFKNARVNDTIIPMDSPVLLIGGVTYVPLKFVSQIFEAKLTWDGENKQATIRSNGQTVVVHVQSDESRITDSLKISHARLNLLSEKLNETSKLSEIKHVQTYFKPYFTEKLIGSIVGGQELQNEWIQYEVPENSVYYTSSTTGTLSQSFVLGNTLTGESHCVYDRNIELVYREGVWKVNQMKFAYRTIPNLGYDR
ncbi:copper amine oxidase N-terminal domain-containing protein [Paenibacillus xylanilyticus]|uniref:copper amine oxidase N-terminal domain-containing protein n=1 Tax=Paenibacillus xylanilyticus TaxID=248903 RepID=UPI003AAD2C25